MKHEVQIPVYFVSQDDGKFETTTIQDYDSYTTNGGRAYTEVLEPVFENGRILRTQTLQEIRNM